MHQTCEDGRRLLDAYLMALANEYALRIAVAQSGEEHAQEIRIALDHLVTARRAVPATASG